MLATENDENDWNEENEEHGWKIALFKPTATMWINEDGSDFFAAKSAAQKVAFGGAKVAFLESLDGFLGCSEGIFAQQDRILLS